MREGFPNLGKHAVGVREDFRNPGKRVVGVQEGFRNPGKRAAGVREGFPEGALNSAIRVFHNCHFALIFNTCKIKYPIS